MCYDMSYFSTIKLVADYLQLDNISELDFIPTYHQVAQSFCKWPVAVNDDSIKIKLFEWGLIASYMNSHEKIKQYRSSMANARSEKILDDKSSAWHRIRNQRCLVFTTGFFEHQDTGSKKKQPYFIKANNETVFCFAGLYNYSPLPNKETGELIGTFAIITRPANTLMKTIHNGGPNAGRMPLILSKELAKKWLKKDLAEEEIRHILNYEFPSEELTAWPVNSIRKMKEDDETVIKDSLITDKPTGSLF